MKNLIVNGDRFSDLSGFYEEASEVFTKDLDWKLGESLDAFNDILYGGFGVFEPKEEIILTWLNHEKSKIDLGLNATVNFYETRINKGHPYNSDLNKERLNLLLEEKGQTLFEIIVEIIQDHRNINFVLN